jgi:hypothetical protein
MGEGDRVRPLLQALTQDLQLLIAQTVTLARGEAAGAVWSTVLYLGIALAGACMALGGVLVLLSALVLIAIALGLPPWAAAATVGLLIVLIGAGTTYFCVVSLSQIRFDLPRTRRSVQDTVAWLSAQANG